MTPGLRSVASLGPSLLAINVAPGPLGGKTSVPFSALATIRRRDGRYAGPVGWINAAGDGEWCIGLRSAEISPSDPTRLRLFAGCGIVAASEVGAEWAESEAKLEPMRRALGASIDA